MDKITVQRANVVLDISPDQKDFYLAQGYAVVDKKGNVIEDTTIPTVESLTRQVRLLQSQLEKKDREVDKLQEELRKLKKAVTKAKE